MAEKDIYIPYPAKGLSETYGYSYQEELTSRDERNMRTRDPRTGRFRGAQRAGMSMFKDIDDQANGSSKIRNIAVVPVSANTTGLVTVRTSLSAEHIVSIDSTDHDRILHDSPQGLFSVSSKAGDEITTRVITPDGEILATVITPCPGAWPADVPVCSLIDSFGNLVVATNGDSRMLYTYDLSGDTPTQLNAFQPELDRIGFMGDIHDMVVVGNKLYVLSLIRDDVDTTDESAGQPLAFAETDRACELQLFRYIDYYIPDQEDEDYGAWEQTFWQDASLADHFDGTMVDTDAKYAPPSAAFWKNPGYGTVGRLSVDKTGSKPIVCVSVSNAKYARTTIYDPTILSGENSSTFPVATFGQGKTSFGYRFFSQAGNTWGTTDSYPNIYIGDERAILGTGTACHPVKDAPSDNTVLLSSMGMTRWDAATTQTLTVTGTPAAGDSLVITGPRESDGTICTLTIEFASGTVTGTFPARVTTTATSMTVTVSLGSVSGVADPEEWAALIDGAYTLGVWYTKESTHGNAGNALFKDCAPNVVVARVPAQYPNGAASAKVTITHPDVRTALTSSSYVQVNGTWSDRSDAAQTAFTNATSTPNLRLHPFPGTADPTEVWGYDLGGMTSAQLKSQTTSVDASGNTYFATRGDSYNFGGARVLLVVPYVYQATSTAFTFTDAATSIDSDTVNILPSRFGSDFETTVNITNEVIGSQVICRTVDYDNSINTTGREVYIAVVAGDTLKQHTASGYTNPSNNAVFDTNGYVDSAVGFERAYYTDGIKYWQFAPTPAVNGTVSELAASAGQIPQFCQLIAYYRDRLVIAREAVFPGRWHMSKVGDPTNWDFLPAVPTVLDAVSSQTSQAGQVPDAINALIPFTDDLLIFGGDTTIWQLAGDPLAANSFFDLVTDQTGIAFGHAWCKDPEGNLFFFGTDGGLFFMAPQSRPVRLSLNRVEYQLRSIDFSLYRIELAYNSIDEGVHIFQVPIGAGGSIVDHWFYEVSTQSWHKDRFGLAATDLIQPTATARSNGDLPQDRVLLLGGEDGRIRCLPESPSSVGRSDEKTNTSNVAIDSYITVGPLVNNPYQGAAQMTEFGAVLSHSGDGANFEFFSTDEPENLGAAVARGTLRPGRNDRRLVRVSGDHLFMRIRNASVGECWAWEGGYAKRDYGGDLRR